MQEPVFDLKLSKKSLTTNFLGGIFYLYLFLISAPIFVTLGSHGIKFTNAIFGTRGPQGFTVNIGILLLPVIVVLLGLKSLNKLELKVGHFGKLIIIYSYICFLVMLYGLFKEAEIIRFLLLGQVITPFIAYFYLLNFTKHIKFNVVKIILISSLLLQFSFFVFCNHLLPGNNIFTSSSDFMIGGKSFFVYGIFDYYPILFLTLVIFFHAMVNKVRSALWGNVLIIFTIILYAYGLVFHSRNSMIALFFLFAFYLFKRGKEKKIFNFFIWITIFSIFVVAFLPDALMKNASYVRLMTTVNKIINHEAFGEFDSTTIRFQAHEHALKVAREKPLAGVAFKYPLAAHNQYLSILGVSGIVAFSVFMLLLWRIYQKLRRNFYFLRKKHRDASIAGAMYAIFILFVVSSLFQNNFTVTYTSCIFWALMGICEINIRKDQEDLMSTAKQGVTHCEIAS